MSGREAILLVRGAPLYQVRAWLVSPASTSTLRAVCRWRLEEENYGWRALLREMGLVHLGEQTGCERAEQLWREGFHTDEAIAKQTDMVIATVKSLRRTVFRESQWASQAAGKHVKAYRLVA